jgi:hypothetical protein
MLIQPKKNSGIPVGTILNSFTLPSSDWKIADGSLLLKASYPLLSERLPNFYPGNYDLWEEQFFPTNDVEHIAYNGTIYVAIGSGISTYYTSTNLIDWTSRNFFESINSYGIIWCEELNMFILICSSSGKILTSSDGINWDQRSTPVPRTTWRGIAYNGTIVCVISYDGHCVTSSNGIDWSEYSSPNVGYVSWFNSFIVHKENFYVSLYGKNGPSGSIYKSTNGQSWTLQSVLPGMYNTGYIDSDGTIIVAISNFSKISISYDDGITWETGTIVETEHEYDYFMPEFPGGIKYVGGYWWLLYSYDMSISCSPDASVWYRIDIVSYSFNLSDVLFDGEKYILINEYSGYVVSANSYDPDTYVKLPDIHYVPHDIHGAYPIIKIK